MAWRKKKGSDDGEFAQKAVSINAAEFVPNSDAEATTLQQRSSASEKEESEQEERKFSLQAIKNSQANATMMFSTSELDQTSPVSVISPAADDPKELGPIKRGSYREASLRWKNESTIGSHASRGKESLKVKGITAVKASSSASSSRGIFPEKDLTSDIPDGSFERRISTASPERNPASMRKVESEKMQIPYGKEQLSKTLLGAWRNGKGLSSQDSKFLVSNGLGRRSSSLPKGIEGGRGRASAEQKRISGTDFDSPWGVRAPPKEAGLSAERGSSKTFRIADFAAVVQGLKGRKNTDADGELDSLTDEEGSDQDFTSSTPVDMFRDEFVEFSMQNLQKPSKKSRLRKSTAQL